MKTQFANAKSATNDVTQGQAVFTAYFRFEKAVVELLRRILVEIDPEREADGSHSYHENLLIALETEPKAAKDASEDEQKRVRRHIAINQAPGNSIIQAALIDAKNFRNRWKPYKDDLAQNVQVTVVDEGTKAKMNTALNALGKIMIPGWKLRTKGRDSRVHYRREFVVAVPITMSVINL